MEKMDIPSLQKKMRARFILSVPLNYWHFKVRCYFKKSKQKGRLPKVPHHTAILDILYFLIEEKQLTIFKFWSKCCAPGESFMSV